MGKGKIKLVDVIRGFGFLTSEQDGKDLYFSLEDILGSAKLERGDQVSFETEKTAKGTRAVKVTKA